MRCSSTEPEENAEVSPPTAPLLANVAFGRARLHQQHLVPTLQWNDNHVMSALTKTIAVSPVPVDYVVPSFPSLYWPFPVNGDQALYLYKVYDIWRFTFLWTLIFFAAIHMATSLYAVTIQWRNWKFVWTVPVAYGVIGGIEALIAGSVVGAILGAVYNAGYFKMSTWIPFVWAWINSLVLILSSFSIQGGL